MPPKPRPLYLVLLTMIIALSLGVSPSTAQEVSRVPASAQTAMIEVVPADDYRSTLAARMMAVKFKGMETVLRDQASALLGDLADVPSAGAAWMRKTLTEKIVTAVKAMLDDMGEVYATA